MKKRLTLQASGNSYFKGYKCDHCGSAQVLASDAQSSYCAYCGEELGEGTPVSRAALTASPEKELAYIKCVACETLFAADSDESPHELAASKYCPICSGDSLIASDSDGDPLPEEECDPDDPDCDNNDMKRDEGFAAALDSGIVDSPDAYTEMNASTYSDLQWNALDTDAGEQTAMVASSIKTGNPIAMFRKENAPQSLQPLFAQSLFVSAFNEVAANEGLATAIKQFGGNYFSAKVLTAADIESAALAKMEATALPRLLDCCQMAVEGGVKGLYPDVYASMQKSIVNELVASGVDKERANNAVRNTFALHGSELFGAIVAKAMELYNKPEASRLEAKALITGAAATMTASFNDNSHVKAALEKPTPNFGVMNMTASVSNQDGLRSLRRELF